MIIALLTGALVALAAWFFFWQYHAGKLQTSGHTPPETSWFAKLVYFGVGRLVTLLTVGPIKVIGKENVPGHGRLLLVANHQFPCDFALVLRGAGRHFRAMGDAAQFRGLFGVFAAWFGNFSVTFKTKEERAAGEAASVRVLATKYSGLRVPGWLALALAVLATCASLLAVLYGHAYLAAALAVAVCLVGSLKGGEPTLTIAPQGALMPENLLKKEEFRAGCIRMARAAADQTGEPVFIVPMALHYKRDAKDAHWTQRIFSRTRRLYQGMRNPRYFDPLFKLKLDELPEHERLIVEEKCCASLHAYRHSQVTLYGAVIVVGEPIDPHTLAADPVDAIEQIRLKMLAMLEQAKQH